MSSIVTRLLVAAAWLAATVTLALPAIRSDASFNSVSTNKANLVQADSPENYIRLFSQSTDPAGLGSYTVKKNSVPATPAATGVDDTLAVALGGYKNQSSLVLNRVFTLQALNPIPATPLTVTASLAADPVTGRQPITAVSFSNPDGSGTGPTATLNTANAKRQVNLTIRTQPGSAFPGNNVLHTATLTLTVTYPGYSGTFLTYSIPVSVWDGNGEGP